MIATLRYGIGQEVVVPLSPEFLSRLSGTSVRTGLETMLDGLTDEADPTAEAIRKAAGDPRSVIEMKTKTQCQPLRPDAPLQPLLKGRKHLEILISQAHAGG